MKKAQDLRKKNEGSVYIKKTNIDEKFRKFKDENVAYMRRKTQHLYPKTERGIQQVNRIYIDNKVKLENVFII